MSSPVERPRDLCRHRPLTVEHEGAEVLVEARRPGSVAGVRGPREPLTTPRLRVGGVKTLPLTTPLHWPQPLTHPLLTHLSTSPAP